MLKTHQFFFSLFLFCCNVFSQQNISLSGKVQSENKLLPEILLELKTNKDAKYAVSNANGNFRFSSINCVLNDTLIIKVNLHGYKPFLKSIIVSEENLLLNIDLDKSDATLLDEVIINGTKKVIHDAGKSTYKINSKDFIKNAKANEVLNALPNVFYNKNNDDIIVEGTLKAKVFIDGIEALPNEIKNIDAVEIASVEIMNNPSSIYDTDFTGSIINIITKKRPQHFFKGSIKFKGGLKNDYLGIKPKLEYKKGFYNIWFEMNHLQNNQIVQDDIFRNDSDGIYIQNFENRLNSKQNYISSKIALKFSEKSNVILTYYQGGYTMKGKMIGSSKLNNNVLDYYENSNKSKNKNTDISTVFKQIINENKTIYFKSKYLLINDFNSNKYDNQLSNNFSAESKREDFVFNLNYDTKNINFFKINTTAIYDIKYVNRNFSFSNSSFFLKQDIFNTTFDMNNKWNEKFSSHIALTFENISNKNDDFSKKYNLLLPTISTIYHFKNNIDLSLSFSRRVKRPSSVDLNDALIVLSPGIAKQGNSNLNQQLRNYLSLKLNKSFETDNISFKLYRAFVNNSIIDVYKKEGNLLINTLDNAAKFNSTGGDFDYSTNLFKKIGLDLNVGCNYNVYKSNDSSVIINRNDGLSFNSSISVYSNLFKDKVSVSFSGNYSGPDYTLLSKSVAYPYFDFSLDTNFWKDKIGLSLYFQNLLGNKANLVKETSFSEGFYQAHNSTNNFSNILLTLTYNFGKTFKSNIVNNNFEIEDIRGK